MLFEHAYAKTGHETNLHSMSSVPTTKIEDTPPGTEPRLNGMLLDISMPKESTIGQREWLRDKKKHMVTIGALYQTQAPRSAHGVSHAGTHWLFAFRCVSVVLVHVRHQFLPTHDKNTHAFAHNRTPCNSEELSNLGYLRFQGTGLWIGTVHPHAVATTQGDNENMRFHSGVIQRAHHVAEPSIEPFAIANKKLIPVAVNSQDQQQHPDPYQASTGTNRHRWLRLPHPFAQKLDPAHATRTAQGVDPIDTCAAEPRYVQAMRK